MGSSPTGGTLYFTAHTMQTDVSMIHDKYPVKDEKTNRSLLASQNHFTLVVIEQKGFVSYIVGKT